jgi:hypothetical protein
MLLVTFTAWVVAAAPPVPDPALLDLATAIRRAGPSPERLAVDAELTATARELARSRGLLLDGAELTAEAGPRRTPDGQDADLTVGVDLPLAADRQARRSAVAAYEAARRDLTAAADVEAELALGLAYVDAWQADQALGLARRELDAVASWLATVEARVALGAEASYETALVAAEAEAARLDLGVARERREVAWAELRSRADVGDGPLVLLEPASAEPSAASGGESSVLARAVRSRDALDRALLALEVARAGSRWSLGATLAREGEEDVARFGVGYRLPLSGETAARAAALAGAMALAARRTEVELARLAGRLAGARELADGLAAGAGLDPDEVDRALAALGARVTAGKDRPSSVLPLRRQLVGSLATALAARAARLRATFEINALTLENPR